MGGLTDLITKPGLLPRQFLKEAADKEYISAAANPLHDSQFQPASIDLRVGEVAYRLSGGFMPHPSQQIQPFVSQITEHSFKLDPVGGGILETNHTYLLHIQEILNLPQWLRGRTSPKSSIGRLDVFVRVLAEGTVRFDDIPAGYKGPLYVLVTPRSFAVIVRPGDTLTQLRLLTSTHGAMIQDQELTTYWRTSRPLLYRPRATPTNPIPIDHETAIVEDGLFLSADFHRPPKAPLAYTSRQGSALIDLRRKGYYKSQEYWEPVVADREPNSIKLLPKQFYLVRCRERLSIPPWLAADMLPFDVRLGDFRSHYAGFFDPGFGYDSEERVVGSQAVLEIRCHDDFPLLLRHGHMLCRLQFFRMLEEPDLLYGDNHLGSSYQEQRYPFSKHFIPPRSNGPTEAQAELGFITGDK